MQKGCRKGGLMGMTCGMELPQKLSWNPACTSMPKFIITCT